MDNHWDKLPKSWANALDNICPEKLVDLLKSNDGRKKFAWPLSILCLMRLLSDLCLSRLYKIPEKVNIIEIYDNP